MLKLYSQGLPKCQVLKYNLELKNMEYTEQNSMPNIRGLDLKDPPILECDGVYMDFNEALAWLNTRQAKEYIREIYVKEV